MPSLSSLLLAHGPLLVIDAAATRLQVGLLRSSEPPIWASSDTEAGTAVFQLTTEIFSNTKLSLDQVGGFIFCEGPGSMLGIRTVAMALRTWLALRARPTYAYSSLTLAAHLARAQQPGIAFAMLADARRESWHCLTVDATGQYGELRRTGSADLPATPLLTPAHFRCWSQPPRPMLTSGYDLAEIFPTLADEDYFRAVEAPEPFQHTATEYQKWSAQIHQAASFTP